MRIAMVGLGRMGGNMARRLARGGVEVVAWNRSFEVTEALAQETGARAVRTFDELVEALPPPRIVWLMLPAGAATEEAIGRLTPLLSAGDLVVDGANGYYKDAIRHGVELKKHGLQFIDCGVSGGIWGLANGYCLMFGGEAEAASRITPYMRVLAPTPETGWLHCGPVGAGHFTKMIHNGIEYGMMQALAEGFALLGAKREFELDLAAIAELWRHGSVVRSWLLDLTAEALAQDARLADIEPYVPDSGEGRWTALEAVEQGVPTPVMTLALMMRFASQGKNDFPAKLLAMMRKGFGGHAVKTGSKA
ncbi:MAG: decarboxylating 6-phosphogluconate dehydrogenase [Burkholderiales bacterium]|nr:decarboxylating 6-phosphogluconate dehydrogenase [Burkholderiales bacterium]